MIKDPGGWCMEKKRRWCVCRTVLCVGMTLLMILSAGHPLETVQAAVVADRVRAVARIYPGGSYYNGYMSVDHIKDGERQTYIGHECAGFVMYVTDKAFQETYYNGSPSYRKVYKTVSTKNIAEMKILFSRAKIGDVIRWTGRGGRHQAIFLENHPVGIQVYEANFGSDYNRVWYDHLWPWDDQALWSGTSSNVSVFRYKDYGKIDRAVKKVSLDRTKLTLKKGKKVRLKASASPSNAYDKKVTWKSSRPKIAKVDARGVVRGLKKGRASITATARDGSGKKAVCKVTVR